ncbi:hypothetical protein HS088_TW09G01244 [Tripterygium wilfordii]|uniref:Transmembrane protein n=1 Tax=Tripterygium wilfordii TaxID=458696 RepID=A0A7J7DA98_TRIWF|nr:hypothetical protein HS088_TW09G01244 [Tripterygium wilfordii]
MGRKIPIGDDILVHPILSLSLIVVGFAATIAIITSLCVGRFLRRSQPDSSNKAEILDPTPPATNTTTETTMTPPAPQVLTTSTKTEDSHDHDQDQDQDQPIKQLPLPPAMLQVKEINDPAIFMKKSASTRSIGSRLNTNISMKLPRSLSMARGRDRVEKVIHQRKKGKTEDSIWMKTIILGEKCKVPAEDDAVVYDGEGNEISTYHPKTTMSRTNSCIDPTAVPKQEHGERRLTINGEDEGIHVNG